jgi:hypothetical protein
VFDRSFDVTFVLVFDVIDHDDLLIVVFLADKKAREFGVVDDIAECAVHPGTLCLWCEEIAGGNFERRLVDQSSAPIALK